MQGKIVYKLQRLTYKREKEKRNEGWKNKIYRRVDYGIYWHT